MAGITSQPFRQLCLELIDEYCTQYDTQSTETLAGIFVDEMVAARAIAGKISKVRAKATFAHNERFRSLQLHCTDALWAQTAAFQIASERLADHIDLNFGCPVKKVTKNGGGSALGANPDLLRAIIHGVKRGVEEGCDNNSEAVLPISAKFRIGIDDDDVHFLRTAEIAVEEGCELLTLHARTAQQFYSGKADWSAIKLLRDTVPKEVLVFANGDILTLEDAIRCVRETGANGVAIGRGCMGRPWVFAELSEYYTTGSTFALRPKLKEVVEIMMRHLELTVSWVKAQGNSELAAVKLFRQNIGPYLKGFNAKEVKMQMLKAVTVLEIDQAARQLDLEQDYPTALESLARGRSRSQKKVFLPPKW
jgi:nifR3 family TIM-barrel protein